MWESSRRVPAGPCLLRVWQLAPEELESVLSSLPRGWPLSGVGCKCRASLRPPAPSTSLVLAVHYVHRALSRHAAGDFLRRDGP